MKILVTGAAGFIGSALTMRLLDRGDEVVGIDNHNSYYDPKLKSARLARHADHPNYTHLRMDISDREAVHNCFATQKVRCVVNLAAQAGVRFSIDNPLAYIDSNIVGFTNVLEECRHNSIEHLVYASSSSVYGANSQVPFSEKHQVNHPLSVYAASKKSNELLAHAYSHLYDLATTGLRFFTVYGPWGRPDMALFMFTKAILAGERIPVFNFGHHRRDFTYISDVVEGLMRVIDSPARSDSDWNSACPNPNSSAAPWRVYNIGNSSSVELLYFIEVLENALGKKALLDLRPPQPGDVLSTYADVTDLSEQFEYSPKTELEKGVADFVTWYRDYFKV